MPGINFDVLVGSAHLGRIVPKQRVREMVFTGERVGVEEILCICMCLYVGRG